MTILPDHLILFDGVCNFCNASVQFILRRDRKAVFMFASIQSEIGREVFHAHGLNPDDPQTIMLLNHGHPLLRSDAAIGIATQFGGLWRLVAVFKIIPKPLRDLFYGFIAKHRYQWFGKSNACMIPSAAFRQRFLT